MRKFYFITEIILQVILPHPPTPSPHAEKGRKKIFSYSPSPRQEALERGLGGEAIFRGVYFNEL
jgi:hypothetical protein